MSFWINSQSSPAGDSPGVVQVRVARPMDDKALTEAKEFCRQLARLNAQSVLLGALSVTGDKASRMKAIAQRDELQIERSNVQGELNRLQAVWTITVDVQRATLSGHMRYAQALQEVVEWRTEQQIANLKATGIAITNLDVLSLAPLTKQQGLDYFVMVNCAAIEGAVCRDAMGQPVVTNLAWPANMPGWAQIPGDVVEALLRQVYALNPAWRPPTFARSGDTPRGREGRQ